MSNNRPNNPRAVAEAVSIMAWHDGFSGERAEAALSVDLNFRIGRVGGENDSPVRFRLRLRRAEVNVIKDPEGILEPVKSSVARPEIPKGQHTTKRTKSRNLSAGGGVAASGHGANVNVHAEGGANQSHEDIIEFQNECSKMEVTPKHGSDRIGFEITPVHGSFLEGPPWNATEPRLRLRDTNPGRELGQPPAPVVTIECLREDLEIFDVQCKNRKWKFNLLSREKQVATIQALREEIMEAGFTCGDLSEPFTRLVLADVVAEED